MKDFIFNPREKFDTSKEFYTNLLNSEDSNLMLRVSNYYYKNSFNLSTDMGSYFSFEEASLTLLERAVELNNPWAMIELAQKHRYGTDYIGKSPYKSFGLCKKAADMGCEKAMLFCADLLLNELKEEPHSKKDAIAYIRLAMKTEYPPAYKKMSEFYFKGIGVREDYDKGFELLTKAAELGDIDAQVDLECGYF